MDITTAEQIHGLVEKYKTLVHEQKIINAICSSTNLTLKIDYDPPDEMPYYTIIKKNDAKIMLKLYSEYLEKQIQDVLKILTKV